MDPTPFPTTTQAEKRSSLEASIVGAREAGKFGKMGGQEGVFRETVGRRGEEMRKRVRV